MLNNRNMINCNQRVPNLNGPFIPEQDGCKRIFTHKPLFYHTPSKSKLANILETPMSKDIVCSCFRFF